MSDLEDLRELLTADDGEGPLSPTLGTDAQEPADGLPAAQADADVGTEEPDADSAEARVAAVLSEGLEEEPADGDEEDGEEPEETQLDEDTEALLAEARAARAARAEQEALKPYHDVYAAAESRIATAKQHYAQERRRITATVKADARNAHDPDAYEAQHLDAAIDGVIAAEEAWIAGIASDARDAVQYLREQQSKPAWAAHLAAERHLPAELIPKILAVGDPRQMPMVADLLVESRQALANARRQATRRVNETHAANVRTQQTHPGVTGRPRPAKEVELQGTAEEYLWIASIPN